MHLPPVYFAFTGIFVLGLISPGPDFALITRNSLLYSHTIGRWSALGIALGIFVHISYCLIGIGFIIEKSLTLFSLMKFAGAGYLIYLGSKSLLSKQARPNESSSGSASIAPITPKEAVTMGFATNALNPKVAVLFVSLFTQVLGPHVSTGIKMLYGSEMVLFTLGWFLLLASVFAQMAEKQGFKSFLRYVGKITGVALIAFGIRLAFVRAH